MINIQEIIKLAQEFIGENNLEQRQQEVNALLNRFNQSFPKENLNQLLNLDNYVLRGDDNTFCHWLEYKTSSIANIGGVQGELENFFYIQAGMIFPKTYFIYLREEILKI